MSILPHIHYHGDTAHDPCAPILEVKDLDVCYGEKCALQGVNLHMHTGERIALVGPNGAGKSTFFKAVTAQLPLSRGKIRIAGGHPGGHICIAYLPQRTEVDWHFPVTVFDAVMMGRAGRVGLLRRPGRRDREIVSGCLAEVGLAEHSERHIRTLSGGQQQRMFIARALAQEAELMLMDEPFAGLDAPSQLGIIEILDRLRGRGVSIVVSLHDLDLAALHFDRILLLNTRVVGLGTSQEVMTSDLLRKAFGRQVHLVDGTSGRLLVEDSRRTVPDE